MSEIPRGRITDQVRTRPTTRTGIIIPLEPPPKPQTFFEPGLGQNFVIPPDMDRVRATIESTNKTFSDIDSERSAGNYTNALVLGRKLWAKLTMSECHPEIYVRLARVASEMCLLCNPLQDINEINRWLNSLTEIYKYLYDNYRGNPDVAQFLRVLGNGIFETFASWNKYLETFSEMRKKPFPQSSDTEPEESVQNWSFSPQIAMQPLGEKPTQLQISSNQLLYRIYHLARRLDELATAQQDRVRSHPPRDLDARVRVLHRMPEIQTATEKALRMNNEYSLGFQNPAERSISPHALDAGRSQVRNYIDLGHVLSAFALTQDIDRRITSAAETTKTSPTGRIPENNEKLRCQIHSTMGYGLLITADKLIRLDPNNPDDAIFINNFMKEMQKSRTYSGNVNQEIDQLIKAGMVELNKAREITSWLKNQNGIGKRIRSQQLFGLNLALTSAEKTDQRLNDDYIKNTISPMLDECASDLPAFKKEDEMTCYMVAIPRIAETCYLLDKNGYVKFKDNDIIGRQLMQILKPIAILCARSRELLSDEIHTRPRRNRWTVAKYLEIIQEKWLHVGKLAQYVSGGTGIRRIPTMHE